MKKTMIFIFFVFCFTLLPMDSMALSGSVSINCPKTTIATNEQITCSILGNSQEEVAAISAKLSSSNNMKISNISTASIWQGNGADGLIELYTDENKKGNFAIGTFTVASTSEGKGSIIVNNIFFTDKSFNENSIQGSSVNITIKNQNNTNTNTNSQSNTNTNTNNQSNTNTNTNNQSNTNTNSNNQSSINTNTNNQNNTNTNNQSNTNTNTNNQSNTNTNSNNQSSINTNTNSQSNNQVSIANEKNKASHNFNLLYIVVGLLLVGILIVIMIVKKKKTEKSVTPIQQPNGFYNNANTVNPLQNNQNFGQQTFQIPQPVNQPQQSIANQVQGNLTQTSNYPNEQNQINNQNNTNSNL